LGGVCLREVSGEWVNEEEKEGLVESLVAEGLFLVRIEKTLRRFLIGLCYRLKEAYRNLSSCLLLHYYSVL